MNADEEGKVATALVAIVPDPLYIPLPSPEIVAHVPSPLRYAVVAPLEPGTKPFVVVEVENKSKSVVACVPVNSSMSPEPAVILPSILDVAETF